MYMYLRICYFLEKNCYAIFIVLWNQQMKGPVEKGRKWRFVVKIEIAPI